MENTFFTQRTHTRIMFQPLRTQCQLVCITPLSPMSQVVNTRLSQTEYEPNRQGSPTTVLPEIRVKDPDDVFPAGGANEYISLDSIKWWVDDKVLGGQDSPWTVNTDYEIVTAANDTRGALKIYKNFMPDTRAVIKFEADFLDWRTNNVYHVVSNEMALTSVAKGEDEWLISLDRPVIEYDPVNDPLLEYDYKVARGIPVTGTRESRVTQQSYEQFVNVILLCGDTRYMHGDYGIRVVLEKLFITSNGTVYEEYDPTHPEMMPEVIDYDQVAGFGFDMRLVKRAHYHVVAFDDQGNEIAHCDLELINNTTMPYSGQPCYGTDLPVSLNWYENNLLLNLPDRIVEYPEMYYKILWHTQAQTKVVQNGITSWQYGTTKTWQQGERMGCAVEDLGIGVTYNDCFFDVWADVNPHNVCEECQDDVSGFLYDENNELLII